jgi:hypothetical protein
MQLGFDQTLWILLKIFCGAVFALVTCFWIGKKTLHFRKVLGGLILLAVGGLAYGMLSVSPLPSTLFYEEFGVPPDARIQELKATRIGGAGVYSMYLQFRASPETIKDLFPGEQRFEDYPLVGSGGQKEVPEWWRQAASPAYLIIGQKTPVREQGRTGHFGIRFYPDTIGLRYYPQENLVQVVWTYFE